MDGEEQSGANKSWSVASPEPSSETSSYKVSECSLDEGSSTVGPYLGTQDEGG